ncbi:hypothetical protein GTA08_BOTSDO00544 [Neofusicoccum parvum]|uniref:Uncharacterized protein n=1 Tax=Neofusicoccum parvum TaxID=310453 RepID=A0ACB5SHJ9_9PEZI|nr:hypothetical protein GTA08_BOTSDO00544 [Neofusicoccum parvum]
MISHPLSRAQHLLLLFTIFAHTATRVNALTQTYCSTQNTGTDNLQDTYTYQSLGHCHDECNSDYAFAIVQGKNCWCSNYMPADTQDVSDCDTTCPGYGYENCGNSDDNLYGYLKLDLAASGTQGAASASSTSTKAQTTTVSLQRAQALHFDFSHVHDRVRLNIFHRGGYYLIILKLLRRFIIIIIFYPCYIPHYPVIGGLAGLALIAGAVVWALMLMRRKQEQQARDAESANGGVTPQRNVSTLSRTGLLRSGEKDYTATLPPINTTRQSSDPSDTITPISERRNSRPLFHDQRLNPEQFMSLDNGSHASIISIEDNRDYTRTLNVRNPDPPERASRDSW